MVAKTADGEPSQKQGEPAILPSLPTPVAAFQRTTAITELKPSSRLGYDEIFRTRLLPAFGQMLAIERIRLDVMAELDADMVKAKGSARAGAGTSSSASARC